MKKNAGKTYTEPKTGKFSKGNPGGGRPLGQRNYSQIYREALKNIAKANDKTPEEIEEMLEVTGLKKALKGDFNFWKDVRDRIHGKPVQPIGGDKDNPVTVQILRYADNNPPV